ncbi:family 20 glycosylhydrolase [Pseudoalteromonas sp. MMG022]|uniref:beta-N-acetylhexosaminidase n=1 Tax=Pseudoalteromonas sp. MMG022 TaxID=2909978 RepID=UPI001F3F5D0D|nr:family 20 glycosylhydrolase [Pseudoalteromonas sp. MMG022]MCF6434802.1 beta-N-acetylhexosaminidase [Pseudoalteromonas sp. MMG022]
MNNYLKLVISLLCWSYAAVCVASPIPANLGLLLMPSPKKMQMTQQQLILPENVQVFMTGFDEQRQSLQFSRLQSALAQSQSLRSTILLKSALPDTSFLQIVVASNSRTKAHHLIPQFSEDESYTLDIGAHGIHIQANTVFGAQHAVSSLMQLLASAQSGGLPYLRIEDEPRFAWRGLLIDSVRHFISVETIKRQLDGMAAAKLNVLHWHLTDDQGWRVESKAYPRLTELASDGQYYTQQQIKDVVAYGALHGIRVVPEFGMPGHASAIAVAYPQLMSEEKQYQMQRHWGVFKPLLDVSKVQVYEFIETLLAEMTSLFPDQYVHIGGDEVDPQQWLANSNIQALMKTENLNNGHDVQAYFNQRVQAILHRQQRIMMGWDEVYHPDLPKDIVVQSWRGHDSLNTVARNGYQGILSTGFYIDQPQYTDFHYRNDPLEQSEPLEQSLELSAAYTFTIDRLKGSDVNGELLMMGGDSTRQVLIKLNDQHHKVAQLQKRYTLDGKQYWLVTLDSWMGPLEFEFAPAQGKSSVLIGNSRYPLALKENLNPSPVSMPEPLTLTQQQRILGAEATIWSELVSDDNLDLRIWPRLFAIAERLWSPQAIKNIENMYHRLDAMDDYGAKVVGLAHQQQHVKGLSYLLNPTLTDAEHQRSLSFLVALSSRLEPAHYYTRHHIKYLQNKYHQRAPLNALVDFLPVESRAVRQLQAAFTRYLSGKTDALQQVEKGTFKLQAQLLAGQQVLVNNTNLEHLQPLLKQQLELNVLTLGVIDSCRRQVIHSPQEQAQVAQQLRSLQNLRSELVLAAVEPVRRLYLNCQNK